MAKWSKFVSRIQLSIALIAILPAINGAVANDKGIASIVAQDSNVAALVRIREDFLLIATTEFGFPAGVVEAWQDAVNEAFRAEAVTEDYTETLEEGLSTEVINAVIDFNQSDLRRERNRINKELLSMNLDDPQQRTSLEQEIAGLPIDLVRVAVDLFEQYRAPQASETLMEGYWRAMYAAAEPSFGVELAELWVKQSRESGFAGFYVESSFLIFLATLGRYPADPRTDYIEAISAPEIVAYEQQASRAFERAYNAAIERLEQGYIS